MKKLFLSSFSLLLPAALLAQESSGYECSADELTRRVEVFYETGVTVPCEVHYYRDTEMPGERQVLWRAQNEEGYCEARAAEFVEKLRGMGGTCWTQGSRDSEMEADDTDALAPAEEEIEIPESDQPPSS